MQAQQRTLFDLPEPLPPIDGKTYKPKRDGIRLGKQMKAVWELMKDGKWRTPDEMCAATGYRSTASITARARDFRKNKFGGHTLESRYVETGVWQYRLIVRES